MFAPLRVAWKQAAVSGPAAKLDIFLVCIFHNILSCPVWIELKAETSEQFCVTFPANREVFHHTVSIFIHHVSKILHRGDGVITNTVQNDAWKNRNNNISFIQQPLSRKSWSFKRLILCPLNIIVRVKQVLSLWSLTGVPKCFWPAGWGACWVSCCSSSLSSCRDSSPRDADTSSLLSYGKIIIQEKISTLNKGTKVWGFRTVKPSGLLMFLTQ